MTLRIAMWSGPRNISTAMMRAFENRPDCAVVDEPFYACFLKETGINHPMADEVIASQANDWQTVATELSKVEFKAEVFYQKHMTHHMLPAVDLAWTRDICHCFLIRHPKYVVNSYVQKRESVSTGDIGIIRQLELYKQITDITGQTIPVIDARKTLENPRSNLAALCDLFEIPFYDEMLSWPPGRRDSDGIWASHWYGAVESSSEFEPFHEPDIQLNDAQLGVVKTSEAAYGSLLERCLEVG